VPQSELLLPIRLGLQSSLIKLGAVPQVHQTDNTTAATHKLRLNGCHKSLQERGFNEEYLQLLQEQTVSSQNPIMNCPACLNIENGVLTYAADDGGKMCGGPRNWSLNNKLNLRLRTLDEKGKRRWFEPILIKTPEETLEFASNSGRLSAPTMRAVEQTGGKLVAYMAYPHPRPLQRTIRSRIFEILVRRQDGVLRFLCRGPYLGYPGSRKIWRR
jgi:hypothetical protein